LIETKLLALEIERQLRFFKKKTDEQTERSSLLYSDW